MNSWPQKSPCLSGTSLWTSGTSGTTPWTTPWTTIRAEQRLQEFGGWYGLMRFGGYFFRIHPEQYRTGESAHNLHPKKHQRKMPGVLNLNVALGTPKELPKKIHQSGFKWGFQTFFIFNPARGNEPIWLVFSRGLKPPQFLQKSGLRFWDIHSYILMIPICVWCFFSKSVQKKYLGCEFLIKACPKKGIQYHRVGPYQL